MGVKQELLKSYETPYIRFPENPKIINIEGFDVWKYLTPKQMENYIESLSEKIDIRKFENIFVTVRGGDFIFKKITQSEYKDRTCYDRTPQTTGRIWRSSHNPHTFNF